MGGLQLAYTLSIAAVSLLGGVTAARFDAHGPPAYDETIWTRTGGIFQLPVPRQLWASVSELDTSPDTSFHSRLGPFTSSWVTQMAAQRSVTAFSSQLVFALPCRMLHTWAYEAGVWSAEQLPNHVTPPETTVSCTWIPVCADGHSHA